MFKVINHPLALLGVCLTLSGCGVGLEIVGEDASTLGINTQSLFVGVNAAGETFGNDAIPAMDLFTPYAGVDFSNGGPPRCVQRYLNLLSWVLFVRQSVSMTASILSQNDHLTLLSGDSKVTINQATYTDISDPASLTALRTYINSVLSLGNDQTLINRIIESVRNKMGGDAFYYMSLKATVCPTPFINFLNLEGISPSMARLLIPLNFTSSTNSGLSASISLDVAVSN